MEAIIEIGTNSLKLLIYKSEPQLQVFLDKTIITRLGAGFYQSKYISRDALEINIEEIKKCLDLCTVHNCTKVSLYGTMIFRSALNSLEVLREIFDSTGYSLQILTGEEEAEYSYLAATNTFSVGNKRVLVIDTGGGSTEFIWGKEGSVEYKKSLNIGAVTLTDLYNLSGRVTNSTLATCEAYLAAELGQLSKQEKSELLIGIGGTVTSLSAIIQGLVPYRADKVNGSRIKFEDINNLIHELAEKNIEERKSIIGLSPKRADIILGGILIVKSIMEKYSTKEILVCDYGLRYGLALKDRRKK